MAFWDSEQGGQGLSSGAWKGPIMWILLELGANEDYVLRDAC